MVRGQRIHRLPQRLDYTLIPAPLDLTLPLVDEKSPLPAIIVTPSTPSSINDFSIAFLAPVPKPTIRERLSSIFIKSLPSLPPSPIALPTTPKPSFLSLSARFKARTVVMMFLLFIVMGCHLVTHRMAIQRPHMDFENPGLGLGEHSSVDLGNSQGNDDKAPGPRFLGGWLALWNSDREEESHDFIITEPLDDSWVPVD